ncbi:Aste57867_16922 [Aphanomyces stellatus]|uniref:Aste57867_16922 protein n=1 Tax=Aphanomyces stellatus TaxID=120398 RepID=A0A485L6P3_9STRA|nr:hypothetical protein As57867_016864 [Aphanomyces stellatus]VFT93684.1 Aste57867_16922 [Aphanomyces stellatus]
MRVVSPLELPPPKMEEREIAENEQALAVFANGELTEETFAAHPPLGRILEQLRDTGILYYDWNRLKCVILFKVKAALHMYDTTGPSSEEEIDRVELFETITARATPPFTLQRLIEVVVAPKAYYRLSSKFLNAVHKFFEVSSLADVDDPRAPRLAVAQRKLPTSIRQFID